MRAATPRSKVKPWAIEIHWRILGGGSYFRRYATKSARDRALAHLRRAERFPSAAWAPRYAAVDPPE